MAALGHGEGVPLAHGVAGLEGAARGTVEQRHLEGTHPADLERVDVVGVGLVDRGLEIAFGAGKLLGRLGPAGAQPVDAADHGAADEADQIERGLSGRHHPAAAATTTLLLGLLAQLRPFGVHAAPGPGPVLGADQLMGDEAAPAAGDDPGPAGGDEAATVPGLLGDRDRQVEVDRTRRLVGRQQQGSVGDGKRQGSILRAEVPQVGLRHRQHGGGKRAAVGGIRPGHREGRGLGRDGCGLGGLRRLLVGGGRGTPADQGQRRSEGQRPHPSRHDRLALSTGERAYNN